MQQCTWGTSRRSCSRPRKSHMGRVPLEGLSGTGSQEAAPCDEQGEVTSAPPLCSGHHTHACRGPERKQDPAQSKEAEGGWGRGGGVGGGVCSKEERRMVIPMAQPAPVPDPLQPPLPSCTFPPAGQGFLKVPLRRSPQGQVPLLPKVWSWPYSQPQPQDTFVCFPARKWKPAASPAHAAGSVLLPGASASSQASSQTPSMFSLHRNRHNTEQA